MTAAEPARRPRPRPGNGLQGELNAALGRLAAIAELHTATSVGLCRTCLLPFPCGTAELAGTAK